MARLIQITTTGAKQQVTSNQIYTPFVTFQNNGTNNIRIGDNSVSATKGILIFPTGSYTVQRADNRVPLFTRFIFGIGVGDKIDIDYE